MRCRPIIASLRVPLLIGLLSAPLLYGGSGCQQQESSPSPERPNIILVIGDDHGYRDFGFMGSEVALTPRLDAMAAEATVFSHGYATASVCQPSLRTLLTGLSPLEFSHRVQRKSAAQIPQEGIRRVATLPRVLGAHGYTSYQAGKYWEGIYADAGFDEGMQEVPGVEGAKKSNRFLRDGIDPVLDFIDRNRDGPFFVWFAPKLPHRPHDPPPEFLRSYLKGDLPIDMLTYFASVSWFDAGLGQLLDHLDASGIRDETLVVYLADNGWEEVTTIGSDNPGDTNLMSLGGPSGKMSLYDAGFRTPVIFSWPGRIEAGHTRADLISLADLFPTLLGFAGIDPVPNRGGRDLHPTIEGSQELAPRPVIGWMETVRSDTREGERLSAANSVPGGYFYRDATWHYIAYSNRPPELYEIEQDPDENNNLAAQTPEVVERLEAKIAAWRERASAQVPPDPYAEAASP